MELGSGCGEKFQNAGFCSMPSWAGGASGIVSHILLLETHTPTFVTLYLQTSMSSFPKLVAVIPHENCNFIPVCKLNLHVCMVFRNNSLLKSSMFIIKIIVLPVKWYILNILYIQIRFRCTMHTFIHIYTQLQNMLQTI